MNAHELSSELIRLSSTVTFLSINPNKDNPEFEERVKQGQVPHGFEVPEGWANKHIVEAGGFNVDPQHATGATHEAPAAVEAVRDDDTLQVPPGALIVTPPA